jgi:hypothetical protein
MTYPWKDTLKLLLLRLNTKGKHTASPFGHTLNSSSTEKTSSLNLQKLGKALSLSGKPSKQNIQESLPSPSTTATTETSKISTYGSTSYGLQEKKYSTTTEPPLGLPPRPSKLPKTTSPYTPLTKSQTQTPSLSPNTMLDNLSPKENPP